MLHAHDNPLMAPPVVAVQPVFSLKRPVRHGDVQKTIEGETKETIRLSRLQVVSRYIACGRPLSYKFGISWNLIGYVQ